MRVVITGATGNCGTALVEALVADPAVTSIVGISRRVPAWQPAKTQWRALDVGQDDLRGAFAGALVRASSVGAYSPAPVTARSPKRGAPTASEPPATRRRKLP